MARWSGADNPQWYVIAPGLVLVVAGVLASRDARLSEPGGTGRAMVAAGALLLLGTSAEQAFGEEAAYFPTTVLTLEGVAGLLGAVVARHRGLAVAGSAGVALGALRALIGLLTLAPLFVVFGGVALVLLVAAASLAVLRERFAAARSAVAVGWADWA